MGYTHYWSFKPAKKGTAKQVEIKYQKALQECAKVAREYNKQCAENGLTNERLSGYTAHSKSGEYGGLQINGKADLAHEEFTLREHYSENESDFCKTARKPYDIVVVACLAILKYRLGELIDIGSDGYNDDWNAGVDLARRITKRAIQNPIQKVYQYQQLKLVK